MGKKKHWKNWWNSESQIWCAWTSFHASTSTESLPLLHRCERPAVSKHSPGCLAQSKTAHALGSKCSKMFQNVCSTLFQYVHTITISISINCLFEGPTSGWGRWCLGKLDFIDLVVKGHSQWVVEFLLAGLLSFTCAPAVTVSKTALWIWSKYIQIIHLIWTRCSTSVR